MTIIHKVTTALLEITGVYLVLLQGHQMQKRCKTPNKPDELLKLLKILEIVWQKTWVEKRRRKAKRKWNTINCSEERCVPLTNLCSCVQVCCSARSSTCVTLWIKQAKNGGICNVFVCCLSGGGEILVENSRRGVCKRFLKSLTLFQALNVYFSQLYSDLTEAPRKERYKTYPMQVHGAGEHKTLRYVRPKE